MSKNDFFRQEVLPLTDYLVKYASKRFPSTPPDIREDFVSETLLKAHNNLDKFEKGTNIKGWLATILKNTALNSFRGSKYKPKTIISLEENNGNDFLESVQSTENITRSPEDEYTDKTMGKNLTDAFNSLNNKHKEIFKLIALDALKYNEVSKKLNIPMGTVMSRMNRARTNFTKALLDSGHKNNKNIRNLKNKKIANILKEIKAGNKETKQAITEIVNEK
jgi:RNA polymerase sigma-70 factor (ECF subfamily)